MTLWTITWALQSAQSLNVPRSVLQSLLKQARSLFSNGKWLMAEEDMNLLPNPSAFLSGFTRYSTDPLHLPQTL